MIIYITSPINGAVYTCKTRKEAAINARCSVGRIGEIIKSGKLTTTLRNGYIVTTAQPVDEVQKCVAEIIEIAKDMANGDYNTDKGFYNYESWKQYFCADRDSAFAQKVYNAL